MAVTPTQRSLAQLRADGYTCWIVETWNPHARIRQDLFGCIDILALRGTETLAVQTTTTGVAARVRKIAENPNLPAMRAAGWSVHVHGWRKSTTTRKWVQRVVDVS